MSEPKFCKDCRWYERDVPFSPHLRQCYRPDAVAYLIGGPEAAGAGRLCRHEREDQRLCGPDARFFAPRPATIWQRLRRLLPALAILALPGCAAHPEWLDLGAVACAIALPAAAWLAYWRRERRIQRRADEIVRRYWARGMARR